MTADLIYAPLIDPLVLAHMQQECLFSLMSDVEPIEALRAFAREVSNRLSSAQLIIEPGAAVPTHSVQMTLGVEGEVLATLVYLGELDARGDVQQWLDGIGCFIERALRHVGGHSGILPRARVATTSMIAQDLHDGVAQELAYLAIQTGLLLRRIREPERALPYAEVVKTGLARLQRQVRELISQARLTMNGKTLREALAELVQEVSYRCDIAFSLDNRVADGLLTAEVELQVLHIVREALVNAIRHSRARSVAIELRVDGLAYVLVSVIDDGVGLPARPQGAGHYGLAIMKERAMAIAAQLEIATQPEGGTRLRLTFSYLLPQREDMP